MEDKEKVIDKINEILKDCDLATLNYLRIYALMLKEKAEI